MKSRFLYVANWKMELDNQQTIALVQEYLTTCATMLYSIAICPSATELYQSHQLIKNAHASLLLGAQNCSRHNVGAYTGEIAARTLAQLGCAYCIVGHSERRRQLHETSLDVAAKVERLLEHAITPIICIGETAAQRDNHETESILFEQLEPIFTVLNQYAQPQKPVYIAYEPVWAIGTGIVPTIASLTDTLNWLATQCQELCPQANIHWMYGGSINEKNAADLKKISLLSGFLIGSASLNCQNFKNIII